MDNAKRSETRKSGRELPAFGKSLRDSTFDLEFGSAGAMRIFMQSRNLSHWRALSHWSRMPIPPTPPYPGIPVIIRSVSPIRSDGLEAGLCGRLLLWDPIVIREKTEKLRGARASRLLKKAHRYLVW